MSPPATGSPSTVRWRSSRCQPRGRTSSVAVSSFRRYCLPLASSSNSSRPRTASIRFTWPPTMFDHDGELASSKSAMKPVDPEFSALMTILAEVGPVISTQRLRSAGGAGETCQSPSRISFVSSRKSSVPPASRSAWTSRRLASSSLRRPLISRCSAASSSSASSVRTSSPRGDVRSVDLHSARRLIGLLSASAPAARPGGSPGAPFPARVCVRLSEACSRGWPPPRPRPRCPAGSAPCAGPARPPPRA